ncbi:MAG: hypothetical protein QOJ07_3419 [Thermoleophilaceae bacterium]|jgi:putative sterol carrier protein|nr:hypothetical protein [Thermoleophilaceae bacterium]
MPYFEDADDVYRHIGGLFDEMARDDVMYEKYRAANAVLQYRFSDPEAQLTVDMRPGRPARVDHGPTDLVPEVVMSMAADVAHRFWLGKVSVTVALARGEIKAKGPVAKILRLVPLVQPVFPVYRQRLIDAGRPDLAEAE